MFFEVTEYDKNKRIDIFLAEKLNKSRSSLQKLFKKGNIKVNNICVKPAYKLKTKDIIEIILIENKPKQLIPQPIPIEVLYMDSHLIVVNKPAGIVMYPAAGHPDNTLMNAIAYKVKKLASVGAPLRPGVVHRLDKDTSGVVVIALTDEAYYALVEQFKKHVIKKYYKAIVYGNLKKECGEISIPIGRSKIHRKKMSTKTTKPKEAKTYYEVIEMLREATLIKVKIKTGRTHQIRVHFSAIGHPVLGDKIYGRKTVIKIKHKIVKIPRQMLHSESLGFIHPITKKWVEFKASIPQDMVNLLTEMRSFPLQ